MNHKTLIPAEIISKSATPGLAMVTIFIILASFGIFFVTSTYILRYQVLIRGYHLVRDHLIYPQKSEFKIFSTKLNDKLSAYYSGSSVSGIQACKNEEELKEKLEKGDLLLISGGKGYTIDKMSYSYPCLTQDTKLLLVEIGNSFSEKISKTRFKNSRFIVTSMTRSIDSVEKLRKTNSNASLNSPHLNGNAFDITYVRFRSKRLVTTRKNAKYLKEILTETIWELKKEKKCWATWEKNQHCFHIVSKY